MRSAGHAGRSARGRLGRHHADAVIGDSHDDALSIGVDHDVYVRGMGVPQRIDQPFLHDSVYCQCNAGSQLCRQIVAHG